MSTRINTLASVSVLAVSAGLNACCGFMGYPPGAVQVKKTGSAYDLIFSADCSLRETQGSLGIHQVVVTELPSNRVVCQLEGGPIYDWWRYGEKVPGMSLVTRACAPLESGNTYEIRARGWTVVVIEPSGNPRVVDASCDELIES